MDRLKSIFPPTPNYQARVQMAETILDFCVHDNQFIATHLLMENFSNLQILGFCLQCSKSGIVPPLCKTTIVAMVFAASKTEVSYHSSRLFHPKQSPLFVNFYCYLKLFPFVCLSFRSKLKDEETLVIVCSCLRKFAFCLCFLLLFFIVKESARKNHLALGLKDFYSTKSGVLIVLQSFVFSNFTIHPLSQ